MSRSFGAGEGNRTPIFRLEICNNTIILRPLGKGEENRTPTSGFGDQRDTISLHPHKKSPLYFYRGPCTKITFTSH